MGLLDRLKKRNTLSNREKTALSDVNAVSEEITTEPGLFWRPEMEDKSLSPSGLYPHEILLLDQAPGFYTDQLDFPAFWRQRYGILHMPLSLSMLMGRGFLETASLETALEGATVITLREVLKLNRLPMGGKKAELITRLLENLPRERVGRHFPRRHFVLTETGLRARDEALHIPYIHRSPVEGLTIWSLHRLVIQNPDKTYRELVFAYLEERSKTLLQEAQYTAYRAVRYRMYQFFMEENKLKKAFPLLAEVIYSDLSGVMSGFDPLYRYISEKYFFPYDRSSLRLSTGIIRAMGHLKQELELTEEMLGVLLMQFFQQFPLPFHIFTQEECAAIVVLELRGDRGRLRQVYQLAETRFGKGH